MGEADPAPAGPSAEPLPAAPPPPPTLVALAEERYPARFARCESYREDIEDAVSAYWGAYQFPDAWAGQLYQESLCNPAALSHVGAAGLAQFMPATWREVAGRLRLPPGSTPHDAIAIEAGAYYQARQMAGWTAERPDYERWRLGLAGYNAGTGNILRAQRACAGAALWGEIKTCLPQVTGRNASETMTYVVRIERWWQELGACIPFMAPPMLQQEWACAEAT